MLPHMLNGKSKSTHQTKSYSCQSTRVLARSSSTLTSHGGYFCSSLIAALISHASKSSCVGCMRACWVHACVDCKYKPYKKHKTQTHIHPSTLFQNVEQNTSQTLLNKQASSTNNLLDNIPAHAPTWPSTHAAGSPTVHVGHSAGYPITCTALETPTPVF